MKLKKKIINLKILGPMKTKLAEKDKCRRKLKLNKIIINLHLHRELKLIK